MGRSISLEFDLDRPAVTTTGVLHSVSPNMMLPARLRAYSLECPGSAGDAGPSDDFGVHHAIKG